MPPPVEVVVLYAPEDAAHQAALVKHLAGLEKQRVIATWSAQKIGAGQDWRKVTDEHSRPRAWSCSCAYSARLGHLFRSTRPPVPEHPAAIGA